MFCIHTHESTHVCLRADYAHSASPVQVIPSPVYPELQVQVKLPGGVLVQAACTSQGLSTVHSLMSEREKEQHGK